MISIMDKPIKPTLEPALVDQWSTNGHVTTLDLKPRNLKSIHHGKTIEYIIHPMNNDTIHGLPWTKSFTRIWDIAGA